MGTPMLVAFGAVSQVSWFYYAILLPFIVSFVYVPAGVGAIACFVVVNWLPRLRVHALAMAAILLAAICTWFGWSLLTDVELNILTPRWFLEMSDRLRFTEQRLLPSWWLSAGLLEASRNARFPDDAYRPWSQSLLFFLLLLANALFLHLLATWVASRIYRSSFNRLQSEYASGRKRAAWWIDRVLEEACFFIPRQTRTLLVKEFRVFRRDPVQWMQIMIFFGLLTLYFINVRHFSSNPQYAALIGFLNLAVVGLVLSTFTTRFIFPMVSLEGRRFWILGLLPLSRDTILRAKFLFAAGGALVPCSLLIVLSDWMLGVPIVLMVAHQVTCVALCFGLSAIAVGLGALMPDLRETSPSKIAAGYGGTLNLVASALYIMVLILFTAVPWHVKVADEQGLLQNFSGAAFDGVGMPGGLVGGVAATVVLGVIATVWPLYAGIRAFRRMEF
jgi:ABC-2 type transport system permease protein